MSVSTVAVPEVYATDGTTDEFTIPWTFDDNTFLEVVYQAADGTITELVLNATFTVIGDELAGYEVKTSSVLAAGGLLYVGRKTPGLQDVPLRDAVRFPTAAVRSIFDKLTRAIQDLQARHNVTVQVPLTEFDENGPAFVLPSKPTRASKVLVTDENGDIDLQSRVNVDAVAAIKDNIIALSVPSVLAGLTNLSPAEVVAGLAALAQYAQEIQALAATNVLNAMTTLADSEVLTRLGIVEGLQDELLYVENNKDYILIIGTDLLNQGEGTSILYRIGLDMLNPAGDIPNVEARAIAAANAAAAALASQGIATTKAAEASNSAAAAALDADGADDAASVALAGAAEVEKRVLSGTYATPGAARTAGAVATSTLYWNSTSQLAYLFDDTPGDEVERVIPFASTFGASLMEAQTAEAARTLLSTDQSAIKECNSWADMLALASGDVTGKTVLVLFGYYEPADGGGDTFRIRVGSAAANGLTADGYFVIENTAGNTTFVRVGGHQALHVRQAGVFVSSTATSGQIDTNVAKLNGLSYAMSLLGGGTILHTDGEILINGNSSGGTHMGVCVELRSGVYIANPTGRNELSPTIFYDTGAGIDHRKCGARFKLADGTNKPMFGCRENTRNWGFINLVLNGNKANQTYHGSHGIYSNPITTGTNNCGSGLILMGCRFEEFLGLDVYLADANPSTILFNMFRTGFFAGYLADTRLVGNRFVSGNKGNVGTTTENYAVGSALLLHEQNLVYVDNNEISGSNLTQVTTTFTVNTTTDVIAGTDETYWYDRMPVRFTTSGTLPAPLVAGKMYYLVQSGADYLLYDRPANFSNDNWTQINFTTTGSGTHTLHIGWNASGAVCGGKGGGAIANRFADHPNSGLVLVDLDGFLLDDSDWQALNLATGSQVPCVDCYNVRASIFRGRLAGNSTYITGTVEGIHFNAIDGNFCTDNSVDGDFGDVTVAVRDDYPDDASFDYSLRNRIRGMKDRQEVYSGSHWLEPGRYFFDAKLTAIAIIADNTDVNLNWTPDIDSAGSGVGNPEGPWTAGSYYRARFQLGLRANDLAPGQTRIRYQFFLPNGSTYTLTEDLFDPVSPYDDEANAVWPLLTKTVEWFQATDSTSALTVRMKHDNDANTQLVATEQSRLFVEKIADVPTLAP